MNNNFVEKHFGKIYVLMIVVSAFLYLALTGGKYVWADEAYTFALIKHSYADIWRITAADVHPPLYYYILKTLIKPFAYSLFAAKIVSILPFMFIIVFGGFQFKKLFGGKTAILFMLLFFLFPYMLLYSIEIRMYSYAAAFVFANAVFAYRCFLENRKLNWILFVLFGLAAAYTHYFALVSVAVTYCLLFFAIIIKKRMRVAKWLIASAATIVLYLPWLRFLMSQLSEVAGDYWIEKITRYSLVEYVWTVFGSNGFTGVKIFYGITLYSLVFLFTYFWAFIYAVTVERKQIAILCCCSLAVPIGTVIIGITASVIIRPVFVIRYIIPALPMLIAFMAIALSGINNKIMFASILLVAILGGVGNYAVSLKNEYIIEENALCTEFVSEYDNVDCYIVMMVPESITEHVSAILSYYETDKPVYCSSSVGPKGTFKNQVDIRNFDASRYKRAMLILDVGQAPDEQYSSAYSCEYIGRFVATGINMDAYLLEKYARK